MSSGNIDTDYQGGCVCMQVCVFMILKEYQ